MTGGQQAEEQPAVENVSTAGATGRVVNLGTRSLAAEETESTGELISKPTYKLRPVSIDQLTDANTMSDKLIEHSSSKITNACGVYVDGQFVCAVKNETDAVSVFDKILNEKKQMKQTQLRTLWKKLTMCRACIRIMKRRCGMRSVWNRS